LKEGERIVDMPFMLDSPIVTYIQFMMKVLSVKITLNAIKPKWSVRVARLPQT